MFYWFRQFVSRQTRMSAEPEVFISHGQAHSVKHSRRCGWSRIALNILFVSVAMFPSTLPFVQSTSPSTNFSFPVIRPPEDFIAFGTTHYNPGSLSFSINASGPTITRLSCVKLFHKDKVRMNTRDSSAMASFSTSFTFSITEQEQEVVNRSGWLKHVIGLTFTFVSENITSLFQDGYTAPGLSFFSVEFDTYRSYLDQDPSDNHIGVNINSLTSAYTYNLCGGTTTHCSFPWAGRVYTAWIDYTAATRSLEVWFANGSLREGVLKPAGPGLLEVPEIDLMGAIDEYMYVGFSGVSGFLDTYEIFSWNFASSFTEEMPAPTPGMLGRRSSILIYATCTTVLAAVSFLGYYCTRQRPHKHEPGLDSLIGVRRFSFKELKKATNNFNDNALLGKGGFGSVYKGILAVPAGKMVAVKRLNHDGEHVEKAFLAEVSSTSQIRHRNLVHLQGWCYEDGQFLLCFDYMSNGTLDEWVFPNRRRYPRDPKYQVFEVLPWKLRFSILAGVAAAVEYLHEEWLQCVLHRDIKSSNVLLDADFTSHLGDFGLARLVDHEKRAKTTAMAGTFGYMAPEMHYTGKATKESDVYSFGILMLEVVCGRRPVNLQVEDPDENFLLVQDVWQAHEDGNILSAVDPKLLEDASVHFSGSDERWKIMLLLQLGLQCCLLDPERRPSMKVVKQAIVQLQDTVTAAPEDPLKWMPPLPSTMPIYGSIPRVTKSSMKAMLVPDLGETEDVSHMPRMDTTISMLRRRFQSGEQ